MQNANPSPNTPERMDDPFADNLRARFQDFEFEPSESVWNGIEAGLTSAAAHLDASLAASSAVATDPLVSGLRDRFDDFEFEPSASVWSGIEGGLAAFGATLPNAPAPAMSAKLEGDLRARFKSFEYEPSEFVWFGVENGIADAAEKRSRRRVWALALSMTLLLPVIAHYQPKMSGHNEGGSGNQTTQDVGSHLGTQPQGQFGNTNTDQAASGQPSDGIAGQQGLQEIHLTDVGGNEAVSILDDAASHPANKSESTPAVAPRTASEAIGRRGGTTGQSRTGTAASATARRSGASHQGSQVVAGAAVGARAGRGTSHADGSAGNTPEASDRAQAPVNFFPDALPEIDAEIPSLLPLDGKADYEIQPIPSLPLDTAPKGIAAIINLPAGSAFEDESDGPNGPRRNPARRLRLAVSAGMGTAYHTLSGGENAFIRSKIEKPYLGAYVSAVLEKPLTKRLSIASGLAYVYQSDELRYSTETVVTNSEPDSTQGFGTATFKEEERLVSGTVYRQINSFRYLAIPLELNYIVTRPQAAWRMAVGVGMEYAMLLGASASYFDTTVAAIRTVALSNNTLQGEGYSSFSSTQNFGNILSATLSATLERQISSRWALRASPRFRYGITPNNGTPILNNLRGVVNMENNNDTRMHPYTLTMQLGAAYRL